MSTIEIVCFAIALPTNYLPTKANNGPTSSHSSKGTSTQHSNATDTLHQNKRNRPTPSIQYSNAPHTSDQNTRNTPTPSTFIHSNKLVACVHPASVYSSEWYRPLSRVELALAVPERHCFMGAGLLRAHHLLFRSYPAMAAFELIHGQRCFTAFAASLAQCHTLFSYLHIIFHPSPCRVYQRVQIRLKIVIF